MLRGRLRKLGYRIRKRNVRDGVVRLLTLRVEGKLRSILVMLEGICRYLGLQTLN
jgi:hypothetical protein